MDAISHLNTLLSPTDLLAGLITLTEATGINDSGQIVANGCCVNNMNICHAFLLTTVNTPEPASLTLLATGFAGVAALGLRRRRQHVAETGTGEVTRKN